jgi:hypothetical protein
LADGNLQALAAEIPDAARGRKTAATAGCRDCHSSGGLDRKLVGGGLTLAFGSFLGVPSLGMHVVMSAALAISGVLVLVLIIALSNPFRGDFRVSTYPYDQVLAQIQAADARP